MNKLPVCVDLNRVLVLALHAFLIWLACGATMVCGREILGLEAALRVHVIAAPIIAIVVSWIYFSFHAAPPLLTAAVFVSFIAILDAAIATPVFDRSYAMFSSILGTWLPFALIFTATCVVGIAVARHRPRKHADNGSAFHF